MATTVIAAAADNQGDGVALERTPSLEVGATVSLEERLRRQLAAAEAAGAVYEVADDDDDNDDSDLLYHTAPSSSSCSSLNAALQYPPLGRGLPTAAYTYGEIVVVEDDDEDEQEASRRTKRARGGGDGHPEDEGPQEIPRPLLGMCWALAKGTLEPCKAKQKKSKADGELLGECFCHTHKGWRKKKGLCWDAPGAVVAAAKQKLAEERAAQDERTGVAAEERGARQAQWDEGVQQVFRAAAAGGRCFHTDRRCYGLRKTYGIPVPSADTATAQGLRACRLCQGGELTTPDGERYTGGSWSGERSGGGYRYGCGSGGGGYSHGGFQF